MDTPNSVWITGFSPDGFKVSWTVDAATIEAVKARVAEFAAAGFTAREQGVEAGEQIEQIGWVLRILHTADDGRETKRLFLYAVHDRMTFKFTSVWLNTPEEEAACEAALGVPLATIREFNGVTAFERGKGGKNEQFLFKLPHPVAVVWKQNPKWDDSKPALEQKSEKRQFVRWHGAAAPTPQPDSELPPETPSNKSDAPGSGLHYDLPTLEDWLAPALYGGNKFEYRKSLNHLTQQKDPAFETYWLTPEDTTEVAAMKVLCYRVLKYKGMDYNALCALLGVKKLNEWVKQHGDYPTALAEAWKRVEAQTVSEIDF